MAVVPDSVEFAWAGSTGSVDRDGPVEYTAVWRIVTDDPLDQAQIILVWWQLNQFPLGTPYAYANDALGSLATAKNIRAVRQLETGENWTVEVQYSREDDDSKKDDDDAPTTNPLEYRPKVNCSSISETVQANKLFYLGGYSPRISAKIPVGATIPVSSNLKPLDPMIEVDKYLWYVSVEQNLATFDGNLSFVGYTNESQFTIAYKGFTRGPVASISSKIRDCEVSFERENSVDFWRVRYYIEILPDGEQYVFEEPDIGMDSIACPVDGGDPADPDLHGSVMGQGVGETPYTEGRARHVSLIDVHGMPIRSPVLLDGDGHALDVCVDPIAPVYGSWWEDKEVDFTALPVLKEIMVPFP